MEIVYKIPSSQIMEIIDKMPSCNQV